MKCSEAKKRILMRDSGELKPSAGAGLVSHLRSCAECRRFEEALRVSREAFQPLEEPSAAVLAEIKREARRLAPQRRPVLVSLWKPALAMAASLLVVLGIHLGRAGTGKGEGQGEGGLTATQLLDPQDQVVEVMYAALSDDDLAFDFLMSYDGADEGGREG